MKEIWKDVNGWEQYYQVSNIGRVRSLSRMTTLKNGVKRYCAGQILKPCLNSGKYYTVRLSRDGFAVTKSVHQLVARAFLSNPLGLKQINHISGDKIDNRALNIEWCTDKHNKEHAKIHGLKNDTGEQNPNAKLSTDQVRVILRCNDLKNTELANIFNVSPSMIGRIKKRTSWKCLR